MSKIPLLAHEKLKLAFWICIALVILIPAIVGGWKAIYREITKDTDGYEKYMTAMEEHYKIERLSYNDSLNTYKYALKREYWSSLNDVDKEMLCNLVYMDICKAQQKYKIEEDSNLPSIYFFVNKLQVARVVYDTTYINDTIYS